MKQDIDLMIDLAYSAIKFGSKEIADEAYKIEQRIHELTFLLNFQIIRTEAGRKKSAKKLEPIVIMGYSIDKISDALSDIARVVYINDEITEFTQIFWDFVPEPIVKIKINEGCEFIGQPRKEVHFRSKHGVNLIAIRRDEKWFFSKDEKVLEGDILIVKGEMKPIEILKEKCLDFEPFSFEFDKKKKRLTQEFNKENVIGKAKEIKKNYVKLTDVSETMIELALAAMFFNNYELAEDILEMEELMDGLNISLEKDLLELANLINYPRELTGIMRIVFSCELISDAAASIAENIVKGFKPHSILQKAIEETPEVVVRERLSGGSYFKGKTYNELQDSKYKKGIHIIALKRNDKWIYSFEPDFIFEKRDLLIGLGPKETVEQWKYCVNPEKYGEK
ncbi:MAG: potassium channel family protein [Promethearchaeia archaeon]